MFQQTILDYQMVCVCVYLYIYIYIQICWFVIFWHRFWDHLFFDFSVPPNFMVFIHRFHHSFLSAHHGCTTVSQSDSFSTRFRLGLQVEGGGDDEMKHRGQKHHENLQGRGGQYPRHQTSVTPCRVFAAAKSMGTSLGEDWEKTGRTIWENMGKYGKISNFWFVKSISSGD